MGKKKEFEFFIYFDTRRRQGAGEHHFVPKNALYGPYHIDLDLRNFVAKSEMGAT